MTQIPHSLNDSHYEPSFGLVLYRDILIEQLVIIINQVNMEWESYYGMEGVFDILEYTWWDE